MTRVLSGSTGTGNDGVDQLAAFGRGSRRPCALRNGGLGIGLGRRQHGKVGNGKMSLATVEIRRRGKPALGVDPEKTGRRTSG
jgi:hypothetical protein